VLREGRAVAGEGTAGAGSVLGQAEGEDAGGEDVQAVRERVDRDEHAARDRALIRSCE